MSRQMKRQLFRYIIPVEDLRMGNVPGYWKGRIKGRGGLGLGLGWSHRVSSTIDLWDVLITRRCTCWWSSEFVVCPPAPFRI